MASPLLEVGIAPAQPSPLAPPVAVQLLAFDEFQEMTVDWPTEMLLGVRSSVDTVAGGVGTTTVTVVVEGPEVPPGPEQLKV